MNVDSLTWYFNNYPIIFTAIIIICIILQVIIAVIPAGPFQFIAGIIYGPFVGSIICLMAFIIGSVLVYCLTKKYGYKIINKFVKTSDIEKFRSIINKKESKLIFILLFIIPGSPKDILSYIAGLTDISLWQFVLINVLGRIPSTFLTAYSGDLFDNKKLTSSMFVLVILLIISFIGYILYNILKSKYDSLKK